MIETMQLAHNSELKSANENIQLAFNQPHNFADFVDFSAESRLLWDIW